MTGVPHVDWRRLQSPSPGAPTFDFDGRCSFCDRRLALWWHPRGGAPRVIFEPGFVRTNGGYERVLDPATMRRETVREDRRNKRRRAGPAAIDNPPVDLGEASVLYLARPGEVGPGRPHRMEQNPDPDLRVRCHRCRVWLLVGAPDRG